MPIQSHTAPAPQRRAGHRQLILASVPRRDAAQRLSLAFSLLVRAAHHAHEPAPPGVAGTASQPAARPAPSPPSPPLTTITEVTIREVLP